MSIDRRTLLQIGAVGLSGLTLPALLQARGVSARGPRAKSCLLLYMDGGPSHIDLFDLKPEAPSVIRGPFRPIPTTVPGTTICEHMPLVARQMHRLMQVRSVRHEEGVHDPAVYQMLTGYKHISSAGGLEVEATDLPHLSSAFSRADVSPAVMPKSIQLPDLMTMGSRVLPGQNGGILGASFDPFTVFVDRDGTVSQPDFNRDDGVSLDRLTRRASLLNQFNAELAGLEATAQTGRFRLFQEQALSILAAPSVQRAFDLEQEPTAIRERYGRYRQGQSTLLARRLLEAGCRFVTVYWGNEEQDWADGKPAKLANNPWDTHRNHFPLVKDSLVPRADRTLAALLEDLDARGLLDETLVVWMGDFGRTPRISEPWASRDHWPHAFTVLLAGAGVNGGGIYGRTDQHAAFVTEDPVSPADLTATFFDALGVDSAAVVSSADGKPHRNSTGRPLREVFG